ncbi:caspase domain-containing protein [Flammula alnicola]|nr:caspase domain-containing protein [Flammula alnicola]
MAATHSSPSSPTVNTEHRIEKENKSQRKKPKKRALLIGVRGESGRVSQQEVAETSAQGRSAPCPPRMKKSRSRKVEEQAVLKGPHEDIRAMRALLLDKYGYAPSDITVLVDDNNPDNIQPTMDNILKAIDDLVAGACPGDRFFFHFAGHSGQLPTDDIEEEDRMNECIVASDDQWIVDDVLHKKLVEPLPPNCTLTAVFDSCHSGSLLGISSIIDAIGYLFPGSTRESEEQKPFGTPQFGGQLVMLIPRESRKASRFSAKGTALASIRNTMASSVDPAVEEGTNASIRPFILTDVLNLESLRLTDSPIAEYLSPERRYCDGFCRNYYSSKDESAPRADIICLSSSKDAQRTWEDSDGMSMTQILVKLLREDPNPILSDLMARVGHDIHEFYVSLHFKARDYKKRLDAYNAQREAVQQTKQDDDHKYEVPAKRKADAVDTKDPSDVKRRKGRRTPKKAVSVEMVNFQNPELSSEIPLEMTTRRWNM